ncbi:class II aldolase/adducin family protein [bacterium]|nr:class II aldolase/adducin family protein [bacterium]
MPENNSRKTGAEIIEVGRRMWIKGWVASNDGNISIRLKGGGFLATATGVSKGFLTPAMLVRLDRNGRPAPGRNRHRPSSEIRMHLEVYRRRPDIGAVVHGHPPYATAFAVAGIPLDRNILPEAVLTLGAVEVAPYGTPSTDEIPDAIAPLIECSDVVLLANHGALAFGADLLTAYHRMETLEHTATITHLAMGLGRVKTIPKAQMKKLMELREKLGIQGRVKIKSS